MLNCGPRNSSVVALEQNRQPLVALGLLTDPPLLEIKVRRKSMQVVPSGGSTVTSSFCAHWIGSRPTAGRQK